MRQTMVKTGKWMLVVLFLIYYLSSTSFYHTHYFSWGTVTHSHIFFPFGDNPAANHNHTPRQCVTIQLLSHILLTFLTVAVLFMVAQVCRIYIPVRRYISHIHLITLPLRAPPVRN
ncbi:MAG: hypothetical protein LBC19_08785 [Tannerella sp.]|nr:hypothetical protein [Tannerella sp.]